MKPQVNWLGWAFFLLLAGVYLRGIEIRHNFERKTSYGTTRSQRIEFEHYSGEDRGFHVNLDNYQK